MSKAEDQRAGVSVSWDIDVFPDMVDVPEDAPIAARLRAYALHIQERYFKPGSNWMFTLTVGSRVFKVDLEEDTVMEVDPVRD